MRCSAFVIVAFALTGWIDGPTKGIRPEGDLAKLQGTWSTVSIISDGKIVINENTPPPKGPATKLAYDGDNWTVKVGEKTVATGKTKLDATKMPKELDVMDESGTLNEKTKLAIYELDGGTYKYCIAAAGKSRPTKFESTKGSGHSLIVSKRDKQ
jgi:uncharacterized protein (TIGR03067 family)